MTNVERALLVAMLDGDMDEWERQLRELGDEAGFTLTTSAAFSACYVQFPDDPTPEQVALYVRHLKSIYPPEREIKTLVAEAVVRAAMGRSEALDGIPAADLLAAHVTIVYAVSQEHDLRGAAREKFISETLDAIA